MSKVTAEGVRGLRAASDVAAVAVSDMQKLGVGILAGCDGMKARHQGRQDKTRAAAIHAHTKADLKVRPYAFFG